MSIHRCQEPINYTCGVDDGDGRWLCGMAANILPIYKGHFVDARLKQFHLWRMGEEPSIIPFDSSTGEKWLAEMQQKGLSTESVPVDSPEGLKRLEEFKKLNVHGSK